MNGTEKQIKWALDIKAAKIGDIIAAEEQLQSIINNKPDDQELHAECAPIFEIITAIKNAEDATFWIDNRDINFRDLNNYLSGYCFSSSYKAGYIK